MAQLDPALVGIWIVPGQPQTYEFTADGGYHVAEPEAPLSFDDGALVMHWRGQPYHRLVGDGATPVGRWRAAEGGDVWQFEDSGTCTVTNGNGTETGIWALRDAGQSLWLRERTCDVSTDGAHLTFHPEAGVALRYGYTIKAGICTLHDAESWAELTRYLSLAALERTAP